MADLWRKRRIATWRNLAKLKLGFVMRPMLRPPTVRLSHTSFLHYLSPGFLAVHWLSIATMAIHLLEHILFLRKPYQLGSDLIPPVYMAWRPKDISFSTVCNSNWTQ